LLAVVASLAACGGGGDASTPAIPATPARLSISGTAAVGAALPSATVSVKCVGATGSATTAVDGGFNVAITGASLPCVLSVTSGGVTLRSVAEAGTGSSATANITPLSELIVARLAGGDAATLFTTFDGAAQAKLSASSVSDARAAVVTALQGVIDLTGVDPIKADLKAANGSVVGNALDKQLDALGLALKAAGTNVASVANAMQANSTAPAVVQTLLRPSASSCAGLRTGKYRLLDAYAGSVAAATPLVSVEAAKGEFIVTGGATRTFQPVTGAACQFLLDNGDRVYVAASGVAVLRYTVSGSVIRAAVLLPEQAVPVSELAGNWNIVTFGAQVAGGALSQGYSTQTIDATGKTTSGADCVGSTCTAWTPQASDQLAADTTGGGFTVTDPDGSKTRVFAYKTAAGQISLVGLMFDPKGLPLGMLAAAKQTALSLPAVGDVTRFWDVEVDSLGLAAAPADVETTVTAVDTTAKTLTRKRMSDGRVDTFAVNSPRDGLRYRAAGSSVLTNGTTLRFAESAVLPLPGTGVSLSSGATLNGRSWLSVSIIKP
jgi:hypothetical protein